MNYCNKIRLAELIREAHATGIVSEELHLTIKDICNGVMQTFLGKIGHLRDDAPGDAYLLVLTKMHKLDPDQNAFSYITQIAKNHYLHVLRKECYLAARVRPLTELDGA